MPARVAHPPLLAEKARALRQGARRGSVRNSRQEEGPQLHPPPLFEHAERAKQVRALRQVRRQRALRDGRAPYQGEGLQLAGRAWHGYHAFKDRLLEKQGFEVFHIPYYDWDSLAGDEAKARYLVLLMTER